MGLISFSDIAASRFLRRSCTGAIALTLAACATIPASAAGFLETLFGARSSPAAAPAPRFREVVIPASRKKGVAQKSSKKKSAAKARSKAALSRFAVVNPGPGMGAAGAFRSVIATPRPPVLPGPLGAFLLDRTLVRGDIVVTPIGLRVFAGGGAMRHAPGSFLTLANATGYLGGRQAMLAAIERNNLRGPPEITYRQYAANPPAGRGFVVVVPGSGPRMQPSFARPAAPAR